MLRVVLYLLLLVMVILIGIALVAVTSTPAKVFGWAWQAWLIAAALAWALRWLIADTAAMAPAAPVSRPPA